MSDLNAKKNQISVPLIIWFALTFSVFMNLGLTFLMPRVADTPGVAVEQSVESISQEAGGAADPFTAILYPAGLAMALLGLVLGHARPLWKDAQAATRFHMLSLIFCESCALMGLMLFLIGKGDVSESRAMMVMALVCMVTMFPTTKRMRIEN